MKPLIIVVYGIMLLALAPYLEAQGQPTPVFVTTVERKSFTDDIEAVGTLKAKENVELTSTVTERVTRINFEDSQRVRKGRLLVEMDAAEELAQKAEEEYRIKEARRQVERLKPLVKRGAASESLLDQQQRELKTAQARVRAIQSRINQRRIVAPFDGVVGLRNISVGAMVQPGTRITTLDDDSIMKLDFSVPEVFLASIKPGTKIISTAGAYPDETFEGEVSGIGSRIDPVTRSIQVRARLNNDHGKLKPGLLMRVVLKKNNRNALVIPEETGRGRDTDRPGPANDTERTVAGILGAILETDAVGRHDNFFDLGADSLHLVRAQNALRAAFSKPIAILDLFEHTTVASLARFIRQSPAEGPAEGARHSRAAARRQARSRRSRA